jgi:VWFA-related protein
MNRRIHAYCAILFLLPALAWAQQSAEPQDPILMHRSPITPETLLAPEGGVHLDVLVTDAAGKPVAGLTQQDFRLFADKEPEEIVSFQAFDDVKVRPDPPAQAILVVDTVNCEFTELALVLHGLQRFLRQNGGHLALPVSIVVFNVDGLQTPSRPSSDGNALAEVVEQINPGLRAQDVDRTRLSIMALSHIAQDEAGIQGRKLVVWLGPGWSPPVLNPVAITPQEQRDRRDYFDYVVLLSTRLRQARIALYGGYANAAILEREFLSGVRTVSEEDPRNLSLSVSALQNGGRGGLAFVNQDSDVIDQLNSFFAEANTFYRIAFNPASSVHWGEYHDLKVGMEKPGLIARTNSGYYNEPDWAQPLQARAKAIPPRTPVKRVAEFVGKPITVADLEQTLKGLENKSDGEASKEISQLALTERLSSAKLASWKAALRGAKARSSLVEVADASVFLSLPGAEIPAQPAPDHDEQRRIISQALVYLSETIPKLPNFYATRTTNRYEDVRDDPKKPGSSILTGKPLDVAGSSSVVVLYRNGSETLRSMPGKRRGAYPEEKGLVTKGTFGPILSTVMVDASHGEMRFSHWEQGPERPEAVFGFVVPKGESHYTVAFRSPSAQSQNPDLQPSGYHGEIAIDPVTGTILRIALQADLDLDSVMLRADIMVEYGAVDIGDKTYTCPVRSVAISQGHAAILMRDIFENGSALGPPVTRLNDVSFADYHLFRGDVRIVSGDPPEPEKK